MVNLDELDDLLGTSEEEEEQEQGQETPKVEEEVDTTDRTIPLLDRIDKEMEDLKFAAGIMGDYERASSATLAQMMKCYLTSPVLCPNADYLIQKWDENKWTFPALWKAVVETAKKELNSKSGGVSGEVVWAWATHLIIDEKPTNKPKYSSPEKKPSTKKKEEPKKEHEQLTLNFDDFI